MGREQKKKKEKKKKKKKKKKRRQNGLLATLARIPVIAMSTANETEPSCPKGRAPGKEMSREKHETHNQTCRMANSKFKAEGVPYLRVVIGSGILWEVLPF